MLKFFLYFVLICAMVDTAFHNTFVRNISVIMYLTVFNKYSSSGKQIMLQLVLKLSLYEKTVLRIYCN